VHFSPFISFTHVVVRFTLVVRVFLLKLVYSLFFNSFRCIFFVCYVCSLRFVYVRSRLRNVFSRSFGLCLFVLRFTMVTAFVCLRSFVCPTYFVVATRFLLRSVHVWLLRWLFSFYVDIRSCFVVPFSCVRISFRTFAFNVLTFSTYISRFDLITFLLLALHTSFI